MRLRTKLTLLALAFTALPVAIAGYSSLRIGQNILRRSLEQNELMVAKQVAGYAASHVENILSMLRVDARILDLTRSAQNEPPSAQALNQVLWLVYHQNDDFCAVAMFDEHGALIGKPASLEDPSRYESLKNHEPMRPTDVEGVGLMAPLGAALSSGQGIGPIFLGGPLRLPHVVLAVAFDPSYGGGKRILAAEVSLKRLANYVASLSTKDVDVKLLDGRAAPVRRRIEPTRRQAGTAARSGAREGELPPGEIVAEYVSGNRRLIGAYAPVARWGLGAWSTRPSPPPSVRSTASPGRRFSGWFSRSSSGRRSRGGSPAGFPTAWRPRGGFEQIAAGHLETRIPQDGRTSWATWRTLQPDGELAGCRAQEDHAADQRDHGVEPDPRETRRGKDGRTAPGTGHAAAIAVAVGAG